MESSKFSTWYDAGYTQNLSSFKCNWLTTFPGTWYFIIDLLKKNEVIRN